MRKICFLLVLLSWPALAERPEVEKILQQKTFEVRLGSSLDAAQMTAKLNSIRRYMVGELGWIVPGTQFVAAPGLAANQYQILLGGKSLAQAQVEPGQILAVGPEDKLKTWPGNLTVEPTYRMPGKWLPEASRAELEKQGLMVFDATSVWATQMTELLRENAGEVYSADQLRAGLAVLQAEQPALVNRFHTDPAAFDRLLAVLRNLLKERVSVRDLGAIGEVVINSPRLRQDPDSLSEAARAVLSGAILADLANDREVQAVELGPRLDAAVVQLGSYGPQGLTVTDSPLVQTEVLPAAQKTMLTMQERGLVPVLVTSPEARLIVRRLIVREYPNVVVLSRDELASYYTTKSIGVIESK